MTSNLIKDSIELLKDLVSIESFSFNENKTAKRIEKWFQFHEIKYTRLKNNVFAKNININENLNLEFNCKLNEE